MRLQFVSIMFYLVNQLKFTYSLLCNFRNFLNQFKTLLQLNKLIECNKKRAIVFFWTKHKILSDIAITEEEKQYV